MLPIDSEIHSNNCWIDTMQWSLKLAVCRKLGTADAICTICIMSIKRQQTVEAPTQ